MVFLKEVFFKKIITKEKSAEDNNYAKLTSIKELRQ